MSDSRKRSNFQFAYPKSHQGTIGQASQECKVNKMNADTISENTVMLMVVKPR